MMSRFGTLDFRADLPTEHAISVIGIARSPLREEGPGVPTTLRTSRTDGRGRSHPVKRYLRLQRTPATTSMR